MFSSLTVSNDFNIQHRNLLRTIRSEIENLSELAQNMFNETTYTSEQNKVLPAYDISHDGMKLLLNNRSISKNPEQTLRYLKMMGDDVSVVVKSKSRFEDSYYSILCEFIGKSSVIRQYPIAGYRVDFFIDIAGVFVEFDEEHHLSKKQVEADKYRWSVISREYEKLTERKPQLIRVRKGGEIKSLSVIAGYVQLNTRNEFITMNGIEDGDIHIC